MRQELKEMAKACTGRGAIKIIGTIALLSALAFSFWWIAAWYSGKL